MHVICTAMLDNEAQKANLCECVKILGGMPDVSGNTVCVEYDGGNTTAEKFVELFSQYPFHGISTLP